MRPDKQLLSLTGNPRAYLFTTSTLGVLGGVVAVAQALCVSQVVGRVFLSGAELGQVGLWVWSLICVMLARAAVLLAGEVAAGRAAAKAKTRLRAPFFNKLLALGPDYTQGERSGELVSVGGDGVEALDAYFSQYMPQLFNTVLVPLVVVLAVFSADLLSGVVLLLTAPVLPVFMILVGKMASAQSRRQWRTLSLLSAHFLDILSGLTTLKLFNRSIVQKEKIALIGERYRQATMSVLRVAFLSALVLEMAATISTAVIAVEIGLRLLYSGIPFVQAFFVLLLAPEFYMPFRSLGARFHAAMSGGEAANRILQIMSMPDNVMQIECGLIVTPDVAGQAIRFENVVYSHGAGYREGQTEQREVEEDSGARLDALRGVTFRIEPGSITAIVGPSGSGKSTIAHLLLRFAEPSAGHIYLSDIPAGDMALSGHDAREWRKLVAWVPQRPYLFHASVAENIGMGKPGATIQEIEQAARDAYAHEFIEGLPNGYATLIGERGARLSGGQAQRIGIARALLRDAPVLIMDEATSSLDPELEQLVLDSIKRLTRGRTTILISHHQAPVQHASHVIVLNEGRVVGANGSSNPVGASVEELRLAMAGMGNLGVSN